MPWPRKRLSAVVDTSTNIPDGTGSFTHFSSTSAAINGNDIAFKGSGTGQSGIYTFIDGTLSTVADLWTGFTGFDSPAFDGQSVAFRANGAGNGIYTNIGGTLTAIADVDTPVPDGFGDFTGLDNPSRIKLKAEAE